MEELLKAIILGAVEGFTEFLPISSTGHLLVAERLLNFQSTMGGTFAIFIQLGATLAMILFFARDLVAQVQAVRHDAAIQRLWINVTIAFVPAAAVGFLLHKWIKEVLFVSPFVIPTALIVGGILMFVVEWYVRGRTERGKTQVTDAELLSHLQALTVGLAQILALIPGVSRSGSTIVGGMFAGVGRAAATRFSFYLAIPTMLLATLYDLATSLDHVTGNDWVLLAVGTVTAAITAWIAIAWLLRYVANHTLALFGTYRIVVGVLILLLLITGWM
jgi:undecaprenyl-diphosphatase